MAALCITISYYIISQSQRKPLGREAPGGVLRTIVNLVGSAEGGQTKKLSIFNILIGAYWVGGQMATKFARESVVTGSGLDFRQRC